jgi:hypothetical protein
MLLASRSTSVRNQEPRRIRQSPRSAGSVKPGRTIVKAAHPFPGAPFAWLSLLSTMRRIPPPARVARSGTLLTSAGRGLPKQRGRRVQERRPQSGLLWADYALHSANLLLAPLCQKLISGQGLFADRPALLRCLSRNRIKAGSPDTRGKQESKKKFLRILLDAP